MELFFNNEYDPGFDKYEAVFLKLLRKTLRFLKRPSLVLVEVNLINDEQIRKINLDYRNKDAFTDVISFAFDDQFNNEVTIKNAPIDNLGVIIISLDRAKHQAETYGHSLDREICFLFVHGLLHLLGYDHQDSISEKKMFDLQDELIGKRKET